MSFLTFRLMIIDATRLLQNAAKNPVDEKSAYRYSFKSFQTLHFVLARAHCRITQSVFKLHGYLCLLLVPRLAIYYHMLSGRIKRGT